MVWFGNRQTVTKQEIIYFEDYSSIDSARFNCDATGGTGLQYQTTTVKSGSNALESVEGIAGTQEIQANANASDPFPNFPQPGDTFEVPLQVADTAGGIAGREHYFAWGFPDAQCGDLVPERNDVRLDIAGDSILVDEAATGGNDTTISVTGWPTGGFGRLEIEYLAGTIGVELFDTDDTSLGSGTLNRALSLDTESFMFGNAASARGTVYYDDLAIL